MRRGQVIGMALAVLLPASVVAAPTALTGLATFISNLAAPSSLTGAEFVGVVQNGTTRRLSLSQLASFIQAQLAGTTVSLSGASFIPAGSHLINAAPGSVLTLPNSAPAGTTEYVSDYQGGAGADPITVAPSTDAPIVNTPGSYSMTVSGQATGFLRTSNATWQIY